MRVIIVGGGIAGLSVAYFLERAAAEGRWHGEVLLIERERLLGGKITTVREDGFIVEGGPDSLLRAKLEGTSLLQDLGLEEELIFPQARTVYVLRRGRLHPIPEALLMLRPDPAAVWQARSLSWWGRLRALTEPWVPPRRGEGDESLAAFLRRRFGRAFAEGIAEPLMAGIHAGDPERLSMQALYPHLLALERNFGSIARGLRRGRSPGTSEAMFVSLRSGMGVLVERLAASLHRAHLVLGRMVIEIAPIPGEAPARYRVALDDGAILEADRVVLAVPAPEAARQIRAFAPSAAERLQEIPFASTAVITLAFRGDQIAHPLQGSGFLVPRGEPFPLTGCTWFSSKWPHRAPEGFVLLRAFLGWAGDPEAIAAEDPVLVQRATKALRPLLGLRGDPVRVWVHRWPQAMPQYTVGHLERLAAIERALRPFPGLLLVGASYRGVGIPDLIRQAHEVAKRLIDG
ncbi:protoporphyrinogen oxidase [Thermoflexus sp.]|uniref:protoporphyrinogen oxidase n=1 Tax=Thermoflexus sp. TaxID=1969742 RepID=UPI0035E42396